MHKHILRLSKLSTPLLVVGLVVFGFAFAAHTANAAVIAADNFNDGTILDDGWSAVYFESPDSNSVSGDVTATSASDYNNEGYSAKLDDDIGIYRQVSTAGYQNIQFTYCRRTSSVQNGDYLRAGWKTGSFSSNWDNWTTVESVTHADNWGCQTFNLPSSANNTTIWIGFFIDAEEGNYGWVDNPGIKGDLQAYCGDGITNNQEQCDGNTGSCTVNGYQGTKSCDMTGGDMCTWNNCVATEWCGDNKKNGNEQCDGTDGVGDHQRCNQSCQLVNIPYCGDGIKNGNEECDGSEGCIMEGENQCTWEPANINVSKVVCDDEADLPNWGDGGDNISSATAADYVASHEGCEIADWSFQWAPDGTANPGDNTGIAGGAWSTPFGGTAEIDAPVSKVWVREVMQPDYVPFSGDTGAPWDEYSAEFYCSTDVLNYDNYDWIANLQPGQNYYCVGFNALAATCGDGEINQESETCDDGNTTDGDGCSAQCTIEPSITICKYNDVDANEAYSNQIDLPLAWGFTVEAMNGDAFGNIWETSTNSETGCVTLHNMPLGAYLITEESRSGWVPTYPANRMQWVELPDPNNQSLQVSTMFLNTQVYDLHGYKWRDLNGNGIRDCEKPELKTSSVELDQIYVPTVCETYTEDLLSGWTIFIDENDNQALDEGEQNMQTDSSEEHFGWYWFEDLKAGEYTICEVQQDGWELTYPASCHTVTLPYGNEGDTCVPQFDIRQTSLVNAVSGPMCNFGNRLASDLSITKSVLVNGVVSATANEGDTLTYTITVKNEGDALAGNLYIEDTTPTNTTLVPNWGGDLGNPVVNGSNFTWGSFNLAGGATVNVTFQVTVNAGLPVGTTLIENTAKLYQAPIEAEEVIEVGFLNRLLGIQQANAAEPEWVLIANSNLVLTTVTKAAPPVRTPTVLGEEALPALTVEKTVSAAFTNPGGTVTYTVVVTNVGDALAEGVTLIDTLPDGLHYTDTMAMDHAWVIGDLADGASKTITYQVKVNANALEGNYINTAVAWAAGVDNVTDTATLEVRKPSVLGAEDLPVTGAGIATLAISTLAGLGAVILSNRKRQ